MILGGQEAMILPDTPYPDLVSCEVFTDSSLTGCAPWRVHESPRGVNTWERGTLTFSLSW